VEEIFKREGLKLDLANISVNPGRRQMAKILMNSFWVSFFSPLILFFSKIHMLFTG